MYLITALICTLIGVILFIKYRDRRSLHLWLIPVTYGAASIMWLVDAVISVINKEPFISFDDPMDGWIALFTVIGGMLLWLVVSFVLNNNQVTSKKDN